MPDIDVSDILLDPEIAGELLTIKRRAITMVKGRDQITSTVITPPPYGSVIPISGEMLRATDQQNLPTMIEVHTPFRLRGSSPGFQADVVTWNGDDYVVIKIDNFSRYGGGFMSAICSSMDSVDNPVVDTGQLDAQEPMQSGLNTTI